MLRWARLLRCQSRGNLTKGLLRLIRRLFQAPFRSYLNFPLHRNLNDSSCLLQDLHRVHQRHTLRCRRCLLCLPLRPRLRRSGERGQ